MSYAYPAIELKDAEALGTDETDIVGKALGDLTGIVEARLKEIETKSATRLDKLEARLNRPAIVTDTKAGGLETKAFGNWLRRDLAAMPAEEIKALTVSVDANGGYLAPEELGSKILEKVVEHSPIRQYASVMTISAESIKWPRLVSGTAATWVAETAARTPSQPVFEQVSITPHELATYVPVSTKILEDNAYGLEGFLAKDLGEKFGKAEAEAFVVGSGTGAPRGLLTATGITEIKTGAAAAFPTSNPADVLIDLFHAIPSVFARNAVWLMNRATLATIRKFKDGDGRYLVLEPLSQGAPATMLGAPIVEAPDMPNIGAGAFPIMFGDFSGYQIVDRVGLSILRDPYTLATTGQVIFHARRRVGGDVIAPEKFAKLKVSV